MYISDKDRKILAMYNEVNEAGDRKYYAWQIANKFKISPQWVYYVIRKFPSEMVKWRKGK